MVSMPLSSQAFMIRTAISPLFAIKTRFLLIVPVAPSVVVSSALILTSLMINNTDIALASQLFGTIDSQMPHLTWNDFCFSDFDGNVVVRLFG
jgi:hypothetical protein